MPGPKNFDRFGDLTQKTPAELSNIATRITGIPPVKSNCQDALTYVTDAHLREHEANHLVLADWLKKNRTGISEV